MKVVALVSGGKDSCFNMMCCVAEGHEIVALANLKPKDKDELDSYMYQTVGHHAIELYADAMGLPLYRRTIAGTALEQGADYNRKEKDEVEDLYSLLNDIKSDSNINFDAVSVGAILSDYQRVRVENVCLRLGLTSLSYLWRRDQKEVLSEMINCGVEAILIKVAALGLTPEKHLGRTLSQIQPHMIKMEEKYGLNPCGEGGEYETFTLDCPIFNKKIVIDESCVVLHSEDAFAPVAYLNFNKMHLEDKGMDHTRKQTEKLINLPLERSSDMIKDILQCVSCDDIVQIPGSPEIQNEVCVQCVLNRLQSPNYYGKRSRFGSWFLASGILGWIEEGSTIEKTVKETMDCFTDSLLTEGLCTADVVAVYLYVADMTDFSRVNSVYTTYFGINPPIRICVEANLPSNILLQLDYIAYRHQMDSGKESLERRTMHVQGVSHWAPANIGPYSQSNQIGDLIYVAGQIPLIPGSMQIIEGGILPQACLSIRHVDRVLKAMSHHSGLRCVQLVICYVVNSRYIKVARKHWKQHIISQKDASDRTSDFELLLQCVVVPHLPKGALIEWQVYATEQICSVITEKTEGSTPELRCKCVSQFVKTEQNAQELYSFICTAETDTLDNENTLLETWRLTLRTIFNSLAKHDDEIDRVFDQLLGFRIFYRSDYFSTSSIFLDYSMAFKDIFGESRTIVPPVFVPVLALEDDKQVLSMCH